jgi:hypothetical protein
MPSLLWISLASCQYNSGHLVCLSYSRPFKVWQEPWTGPWGEQDWLPILGDNQSASHIPLSSSSHHSEVWPPSPRHAKTKENKGSQGEPGLEQEALRCSCCSLPWAPSQNIQLKSEGLAGLTAEISAGFF